MQTTNVSTRNLCFGGNKLNYHSFASTPPLSQNIQTVFDLNQYYPNASGCKVNQHLIMIILYELKIETDIEKFMDWPRDI